MEMWLVKWKQAKAGGNQRRSKVSPGMQMWGRARGSVRVPTLLGAMPKGQQAPGLTHRQAEGIGPGGLPWPK